MLRKTSGVMVSGQGNNVSIKVQGNNSFGPSEPLYVVNGTPAGNDYAQVAGSLNTNEITSITVLKGIDAAIYGSRGGNGVIVIRTK
jgi:TonB-dependent SusC/RagA subfamily outer membrane receptor